MSIHGVHHLPVCTHDGRMVGIITERDLRSSLASALLPDDLEQLQREKLSELIEVVMTSDVCTATPDEPIGPAIRRLLDVRVGALPVVDDEGCLVGILSRSDVLAEAAGLFDSILTEVIGAELSRLQRSKSRQRREKAVS
jgi:CBS domain-containing protein